MLLVVDIGNTNIKLGIFNNEELVFQSRIATDRGKTTDEYAVIFSRIFEIYKIDVDMIKGSIVSCVVPSISYTVRKAIYVLTKQLPLEVSPDIELGVKVEIDEPKGLGSDLAAGCVAGCALYSAPLIIVSLGTATTFTVINSSKAMCGGSIMPGMSLSLEALTHRSSLLPSVSFDTPQSVIGKNTQDCMRSGSVLGTAAMIDAMCERIDEELGDKCTVVATGGLSSMVIPNCKRDIILDNTLILKGLKIIYELNTKKQEDKK
ncbi:MAG: type III pantothenate kinase [Clostridia bacterium]|nr:type III pantothenate kinase [Clostridia bacterium]